MTAVDDETTLDEESSEVPDDPTPPSADSVRESVTPGPDVDEPATEGDDPEPDE